LRTLSNTPENTTENTTETQSISQKLQYIFQYLLNNAPPNGGGGGNGGGVPVPVIQDLEERIKILEDLESRIELVIRVASTENILVDEQGYILDVSGLNFLNSSFSIDSIILQTGNLVLLKDQTDTAENGIFIVTIENENQLDQRTRLIRIGDQYFEENLENNNQPRTIGITRQNIPGLQLPNIFLGYLSFGTISIIKEGQMNAGLKFIQNSPSIDQSQNIVAGNIKLDMPVLYNISSSSIQCELVSDNNIPPLYRVYNLFYSNTGSTDPIGVFKINSETQWDENKFKLFVNKSQSNDVVLDFTSSCFCVYFPQNVPNTPTNGSSNCSHSCTFIDKLFIKPGGRVLLYRSGVAISLYIKAFHEIYGLV